MSRSKSTRVRLELSAPRARAVAEIAVAIVLAGTWIYSCSLVRSAPDSPVTGGIAFVSLAALVACVACLFSLLMSARAIEIDRDGIEVVRIGGRTRAIAWRNVHSVRLERRALLVVLRSRRSLRISARGYRGDFSAVAAAVLDGARRADAKIRIGRGAGVRTELEWEQLVGLRPQLPRARAGARRERDR